ncbi:MAG: hypothetical protein M3R17_03615 [Bacteroidota bacterium]|nr:hypothetical protein [Bacteroidota bacterium]
MILPPLKPWIDVKDTDGSFHSIYLDEQRHKIKNGFASLYSGELVTKKGERITVKIAGAFNNFSARFVRVTGPIVTTPAEIAGQLNRLFAEE